MLKEIAEKLAAAGGLHADAWVFWLTLFLRVAVVAAFYVGGISLIAMFTIWWERKAAGHMQSRLGPMHVGHWHGWAQSIADGVKLILKEDLIPEGADLFLFRLAPYLAFAPVFAAMLALPFGPQFIFEHGLNIGVLYLLAVLAVEVMGVILAGWASNSKWSVYGAMREACQMVSYEIPMGIAIICGVLTAGTLDLVELGYLQGSGITGWFIFHNPFIFAAFILYFIASLASNKRAPFDLPESESELVAGFHTEYSGMRFAFFFFAEYAAMWIVGGIQAALFLGAWNSPLGTWDPIYHVLGYSPVGAGQAYMDGTLAHAQGWAGTAHAMGLSSAAALLALNVYSLIWFVLKATVVVFVQIWLRWTLPRIRIDQVLHVCVKVLLPMSLVAFGGAAVWIWLVPQPAAPVNGLGLPLVDQTYWGHLLSPTPMLQWITQIALLLVGLAIIGWFAGIVVWAYLHRDTQPRKTLFADVIPAGRDVMFTKGPATPPSATPPLATPAPAAPPAA